MKPHPKSAYTETAVRGATPIGLIVMLHDAALKSLRDGHQAVRQGQIEQRTRALNHVLAIVAELQGSLDFEKGGDVAARLQRFYEVARAKVLEASIKASGEILERLANQFAQQRDAWRQVEATVTMPAGAARVVELPPQPTAHASNELPDATPVGSWSA